jgi:hypothetical protein
VALRADGVDGDLVDYVILNPINDLIPSIRFGQTMTVEEISYNLIGFDALLEFDSTADQLIWVMTQGRDSEAEFCEYGGIKDRSGVDATGRLLLTTIGFNNANKAGTFIIKVRKD